ncbi:MAG: hypothetical protein AB7U61_01330 [Methylocystis sp.]
MRHAIAAAAGVIALTIASVALASTASEREYKRGYADCMAGRWDENQHGESYKKGCRAAEDKRNAGGSAATTSAASGSPDVMLDKCRARAAAAYKADSGMINVKYEGQRVDGTHAVNGSIEGRDPAATFQCSFNRSGAKIVKFTRVGSAASSAQQGDSVPSKDKQACLRAVKKQTQNSKLVVLGTESSEANNSVTIGVGSNRAPWRCLVKRGVVADVTSLTDEGKL